MVSIEEGSLDMIDHSNKKNQRKIVNIFLPIIFSICFGCSKEPSHMFWLRNKKIIFLLHTLN